MLFLVPTLHVVTHTSVSLTKKSLPSCNNSHMHSHAQHGNEEETAFFKNQLSGREEFCASWRGIAIKLRKIFVFTTWNRKALPSLYGTNVSVFKKCKILNLMAMKGISNAYSGFIEYNMFKGKEA